MPTPKLADRNIKFNTYAPDSIMELGVFVSIPPHPLFQRTLQKGFFIFNTICSTIKTIAEHTYFTLYYRRANYVTLKKLFSEKFFGVTFFSKKVTKILNKF